MKTVLIFDAASPGRPPLRIPLADDAATALIAAGVAISADGTGPAAGGGVTPSPPGVSGTLAPMTIGQPYDSSWVVVPSGATVTLDTATTALIAAHNITHDGKGRFTSGSVS